MALYIKILWALDLWCQNLTKDKAGDQSRDQAANEGKSPRSGHSLERDNSVTVASTTVATEAIRSPIIVTPYIVPMNIPVKAVVESPTPSLRQLQGYIREKQPLEIKLLTGDLLSGTLFWQDTDCLCLKLSGDQTITVWKQAIAFIQPKN